MNKLFRVSDIQNIADAIRTKNPAETELLTVGLMASAIEDIPAGGSDWSLEFYTWLTLDNGAQVYVDGTITQNYSYYLSINNKGAQTGMVHAILLSDLSDWDKWISFSIMALTYYFGNNNGASITPGGTSWSWILGEHNYLYDGAGSITIDGGTVGGAMSYSNITNPNVKNFIFNGGKFYGQIKEFTITNTANDTVIHHYVPCGIKYQETLISSGLFDTVTNKFYSSRYGTCTATNEKLT